MATEHEPDGVRAPQTMRKTANVLALALAAYREGDLDTSFDLFIEGMESNLRDGETAGVSPDFAVLIEEALSEARVQYDGDGSASDLLVLDVTEDDEDDDLLAGIDLSDDEDDNFDGEVAALNVSDRLASL